MPKPDRVADCLRPFLGSIFVFDHPALMEKVAMLLFGFLPQRDNLPLVCQRLDNLLFMAVREQTNAKMMLEMDGGQLIRLKTTDFSLMADELMYLLFESLPQSPENQALIRDYSLRNQSLAALKALYLHYQGLQSPEETRLIKRIITTSHPSWRYRQWLDTEG